MPQGLSNRFKNGGDVSAEVFINNRELSNELLGIPVFS
jgi:hypothetical protein